MEEKTETTLTLEEINERLTKLEDNFRKLKEWSDLNDYWLREMIDSNTECINILMGMGEENIEHPYHCEYKQGRE